MSHSLNDFLRSLTRLIGCNPYPTPKEIMAKDFEFHPEALDVVVRWKNRYFKNWAKKNELEKANLLVILLAQLNELYGGPKLAVGVTNAPGSSQHIPGKKGGMILLRLPISIITGLHELGHHLFGSSELKACRFSVQLFKHAFPRSFAQMTWNGHMLVRKQTITIKKRLGKRQ